MLFGKSFNSERDIPVLRGKVILVTGGNAGIGEATVRALAAHSPRCIYLCARRPSSGDAAVRTIHSKYPDTKIEVLQLDLSSFDSVKKCAAEFDDRSDRLDLLFLNAGVAMTAPAKTKDGYEYQFGVNHMGHALLTQLLLPKLLYTARSSDNTDVRIITTSSVAATQSPIRGGLALDRMRTDGKKLGAVSCYAHSKLANVLFAKKLAQLYVPITSTACHPGTVNSEIWRKSNGAKVLIALIYPAVWLASVSTDKGAKTQLWCATAAKGKGGVEDGKFYWPVGVKKNGRNVNNVRSRDELWQWTSDELAKHGGPGWPEV